MSTNRAFASVEFLQEVLEEVSAVRSTRPSRNRGDRFVLAAAEQIAAAAEQIAATEWDAELVALARDAVERIAASSEPRELAADDDAWPAEVDALRTRIG